MEKKKDKIYLRAGMEIALLLGPELSILYRTGLEAWERLDRRCVNIIRLIIVPLLMESSVSESFNNFKYNDVCS